VLTKKSFGEHDVAWSGNVIKKESKYVDDEWTFRYSTMLRYLCLPDTVDPRRPKGT